jgi:membrane protein required for beta-lactamase induction
LDSNWVISTLPDGGESLKAKLILEALAEVLFRNSLAMWMLTVEIITIGGIRLRADITVFSTINVNHSQEAIVTMACNLMINYLH